MTAYEMLISDWSSDVCSSDLVSGRDHIRLPFTIGVAYETPPETLARLPAILTELVEAEGAKAARAGFDSFGPSSLDFALLVDVPGRDWSIAHRSEEHTSELQSLMRISYAVFCLKKKNNKTIIRSNDNAIHTN